MCPTFQLQLLKHEQRIRRTLINLRVEQRPAHRERFGPKGSG